MALLNADEFLARVDIILPDDAIQSMLDDAAAAIVARAGDPGGVEEVHGWNGSTLTLRRRAATISAITTATVLSEVELDPDDYRLLADGRSVERLASGPNPSSSWIPDSIVTYAAYDDEANRRSVQQKLVELEIAMKPGVAGETVGPHAIQLQQGQTYPQLREEILAMLDQWTFA